MHVQTAVSSTSTTTTMAYAKDPSLPASPTLTNPDMILPYGEYDSAPSLQNSYRQTASSGEGWRDPTDMHFSLGPSQIPTTPIIYGNGTMLSDIGEVTEAESTPGRKGLPGPAERRMLKQAQAYNLPLRSSLAVGHEAVMKRAKIGSHRRNVSAESTSTVTSQGQPAEMFKDFDDGVSVDDSVFQGDDEESVADLYSEEVIAQETERLAKRDNLIDGEEDSNSSAALSRRAEEILLNAKKRLNNMEGNLSRARSSLVIPPSRSMSSIHSTSPLSRMTPSPPTNGRVISQLGNGPSNHRQLHTPTDSPMGSPGHSRVYSENSISTPVGKGRFPVRSASAAARYNASDAADRLRGLSVSHSSESIREDASNSTRPGLPSPLSRSSPPHATVLAPLAEDEVEPELDNDTNSVVSSLDGYMTANGDPRNLSRSTSTVQMRDLRDQMSDLKGRLSVLRDRARDDTMKRRSLQSLRTPSPFTAAEQWYSGAKGYGEEPLSADAGIPSPTWKKDTDDAVTAGADIHAAVDAANPGVTIQEPEYPDSDVTSVYEDVAEGHHANTIISQRPNEPEASEERVSLNELPKSTIIEDHRGSVYNDEIIDTDDYESDSSHYHDSLDIQISHEDREDAFDYEHFFLHSAMGTIGRRRGSGGSFASEDSVETTRGPTAQPDTMDGIDPADRSYLNHLRSISNNSVSTMASFATAEEEPSSDEENDGTLNQADDVFAVKKANNSTSLRPTTPVATKRLTFGGEPSDLALPEAERAGEKQSRSSVVHNPEQRNGTSSHRPSISSLDSSSSTSSRRGFPLVNKPKIEAVSEPTTSRTRGSGGSGTSILTSDTTTLVDRQGIIGEEGLQISPVHMLVKEDQILVERLVASLGKCVLGLQESGRGNYESRTWRRRLDAARRVLEGQEGAI